MPRFFGFNAENKLRIPLSAYAAQIIESDCTSFSLKKTTLINTIIMNYYQRADCSISLRVRDYKEELTNLLGKRRTKQEDAILQSILKRHGESLSATYTKKLPADVNWQITLNKKVKAFLTEDTFSQEEIYYGDRPGRYVRALIEEYSRLPYYMREEIVFKLVIDKINSGIREQRILNLTNNAGHHISIKPYIIQTDPLTMFH